MERRDEGLDGEQSPVRAWLGRTEITANIQRNVRLDVDSLVFVFLINILLQHKDLVCTPPTLVTLVLGSKG